MGTPRRMAGLRRVFHHPRLLADDPSICRVLAHTPSISVHASPAGLDCDVGGRCNCNSSVAPHLAVCDWLDVDPGPALVRHRIRALCKIWERLQRQATRRPPRSSRQQPRAAPGDGWNSFPSPPSGLRCAPLRNDCLEYRHRPGSLLGANGVRDDHGGNYDPHGGCGIGEEVWRVLLYLSQISTSGSAQSVCATPAIIRFG